MNSEVSFTQIKQFPPLMWVLLFGTFITRGSFYMVWPFLAVILYQKFSLTATEVGSVLSLAAVISVFISFIGSTLSDKLGRKPMMYATGILYIISFSLLANADSVFMFSVVITLCSIATSLWRPLTSALIGDIIPEQKPRELAMQSLYFSVNAGCAVGPMLGVWLGLTGEQSSFYITVVAFAMLLILLFAGFSHHESSVAKTNNQSQSLIDAQKTAASSTSNEQNSSGFTNTLGVLYKDKLLQCLIVANVICLFVYGQMDSSLIQYLTREQVPDALQLISAMIFTNAFIIITFQFILLKLMANRPILVRIRLGLTFLAASQIWLSLNPLMFFWGWIGAIAVMSLAEAILFPTMNVHVDRIAPKNLRGTYFGATAFYDLGFALAPVGGGIILDLYSGPHLYMLCTLLVVIVFILYMIMDKLPRPEFVKSEA